MELRICCDSSVELKGFNDIKNIECQINEYQLKDSNLVGTVVVRGEIGVDNEVNTFNEIVPFTLVFKNESYVIDKIEIDNFSYYEVVNQGIECNFEIVVTYGVDRTLDKPVEVLIEDNFEDNEILTEASEEVSVDTEEVSDPFEEIETEESQINEMITKKYDDLLKSVFLEQNRVQNENVSFRNKDDSQAINFSTFKETKSKVRVYYTKHESEVEKICMKEKVSVKNVYENVANKDFTAKRRIIINK